MVTLYYNAVENKFLASFTLSYVMSESYLLWQVLVVDYSVLNFRILPFLRQQLLSHAFSGRAFGTPLHLRELRISITGLCIFLFI